MSTDVEAEQHGLAQRIASSLAGALQRADVATMERLNKVAVKAKKPPKAAAAAAAAPRDFAVTSVNSTGIRGMLCVVCRTRCVNTILTSCGHAVFCQQCALEVRSVGSRRCPTCNVPISSVAPVIPAGFQDDAPLGASEPPRAPAVAAPSVTPPASPPPGLGGTDPANAAEQAATTSMTEPLRPQTPLPASWPFALDGTLVDPGGAATEAAMTQLVPPETLEQEDAAIEAAIRASLEEVEPARKRAHAEIDDDYDGTTDEEGAGPGTPLGIGGDSSIAKRQRHGAPDAG
jgi:hypothetical protein